MGFFNLRMLQLVLCVSMPLYLSGCNSHALGDYERKYSYYSVGSPEWLGMHMDLSTKNYVLSSFDAESWELVDCSGVKYSVCIETKDFIFALPTENEYPLSLGDKWVHNDIQFKIVGINSRYVGNRSFRRFFINAYHNEVKKSAFVFDDDLGLELIATLTPTSNEALSQSAVDVFDYGFVFVAVDRGLGHR